MFRLLFPVRCSSAAKKGKTSVPNIPPAKCTGIAPTGSSNSSLSSSLVAYIATSPPPAPIHTAPIGVTQFALAVTATRPASNPLSKSPAGAVAF